MMKAKLPKAWLWTMRILAAVPVLFVLALVIFAIWVNVDKMIGIRRLRNVDHQELLTACRQIIANYDKYTNAVDAEFWGLRKDEKGIELWN
jgi:hypothetical protein